METTISPLIQASLSPVFLLSAIGVTLSVIDARQRGIVDRVRTILQGGTGAAPAIVPWDDDSAFLLHRARQIGRAAALCILSAISIAIVVVGLLTDAQTEVSLSILVEVVFSAAVVFYASALVLFLRDILLVNRGMAQMERRVTEGASAPPAHPD
jgi:hypothetical protein